MAESEALNTPESDDKSALLRVSADFANYKRRSQQVAESAASAATAAVLSALLEVLDGYEQVLGASLATTDTPWLEGVRHTTRLLQSRLESFGLRPFDSLGDTFDPHFHEAVSSVYTKAPAGTIVAVYQRGYLHNDTVLRHARVQVATEETINKGA